MPMNRFRKIVLSAQGAAGLCRKKRSGCGARAVPAVKQFIFRGELKVISGNAGMLRLKRGVMKYIAVPGKLELEIYAYCEKHEVQSVLWPQMDAE